MANIGSRAMGIAALLLPLGPAQPQPPRSGPTTEPSPPAITLRVDLPRATKVGPRRAGMLCLPNGAVRVVDLVRDDAGLEATVRQALARAPKQARRAGMLQIRLASIAVNLCARKWGAFGIGADHKALSGQARYDFIWHRDDERADHAESITFDIPRETPLTTGEITGRALDLLLARISPSA